MANHKKANPLSETNTENKAGDQLGGEQPNQDHTTRPAKKESAGAAMPTHEFVLQIGDVVIEKNGKKVKVTMGNLKAIYEKSGWAIIDSRTTAAEKKKFLIFGIKQFSLPGGNSGTGCASCGK